MTAGDRLDYVLPLRWTDDAGLDELTAYVRLLAPRVRVTVVDRSPEPLFSAHAYAFAGPGGTPAEAADVAVRACNVPS